MMDEGKEFGVFLGVISEQRQHEGSGGSDSQVGDGQVAEGSLALDGLLQQVKLVLDLVVDAWEGSLGIRQSPQLAEFRPDILQSPNERLNKGVVLWGLAEQVLTVVFLGNVPQNGCGLSNDVFAVDQVGEVGEGGGEGLLVLCPDSWVRVQLVLELDLEDRKEIADGLAETSDWPVSKGDCVVFHFGYRLVSSPEYLYGGFSDRLLKF